MPDHLRLGPPRPVGSRRVSGGASQGPPAGRAGHGAELLRHLDTLDEVVEEIGEIDPEFIVKLSGRTRLSPPYAKWKLVQVGEGPDWTYYALGSTEAREQLRTLFTDYGASSDEGDGWDHAKSWSDFVRDLTGIELYGRDDRYHPSLASLDFSTLETVDVSIWPSESTGEAGRRLGIVRAIVDSDLGQAVSSRVVTSDQRPETTMIRVRVNGEILDRLLSTSVVQLVREPIRPRLELAQLFEGAQYASTEPAGDPIGVIDDGVVTANRYLDGVILASREFPDRYAFAPPSEHGTAVCGLAAYGDFEQAIQNRSPLPVPHPIMHARVLEPDGRGGTRFATDSLHHVVMAQAIRWLV
jgi:hypothetical protein